MWVLEQSPTLCYIGEADGVLELHVYDGQGGDQKASAVLGKSHRVPTDRWLSRKCHT